MLNRETLTGATRIIALADYYKRGFFDAHNVYFGIGDLDYRL